MLWKTVASASRIQDVLNCAVNHDGSVSRKFQELSVFVVSSVCIRSKETQSLQELGLTLFHSLVRLLPSVESWLNKGRLRDLAGRSPLLLES